MSSGGDRGMTQDVTVPTAAPRDAELGESRWWPVAALVLFMVLNIVVRLWLKQGATRLPFVLPVLEAAMVVVLLTPNPAGEAEHRRMRRIALVLVGLFVAAALTATVQLIRDLIDGTG